MQNPSVGTTAILTREPPHLLDSFTIAATAAVIAPSTIAAKLQPFPPTVTIKSIAAELLLIVPSLKLMINASELIPCLIILFLPTTQRSPGDKLLRFWDFAQIQTAPIAILIKIYLILIMLIQFAGIPAIPHLSNSSKTAAAAAKAALLQ